MNLTDPITTIPGVGESYAKKLEKLGINSIKDLLYHIPHRYLDFRAVSPIRQTAIDQTYTITGTVDEITNSYTRRGKKITQAFLTDESGTIQLIWFNQTYLTKIIRPGDTIQASGKVTWWDRQKAIIAPLWQKTDQNDINTDITGALIPIYPETEGITSNWLHKTIRTAWEKCKHFLEEHHTESFLQQFELPKLPDALEALHFPKDPAYAEHARKRLAFDEMFAIQKLSKLRRDAWNRQQVLFRYDGSEHGQNIVDFISRLPFELTDAQHRVIKHVLEDLMKPQPMNRLIQGDVGSGKTVVAAVAAYAAHLAQQQTIFLAPTEVLAQQHAETLEHLFKDYDLQIARVTGSKKDDGFHTASIIVGTHAVFHHKEVLNPSGLVIIDEQHKFGVEQQKTLIAPTDTVPHLLTMTATPIPRSIALTIYGDQDLSLIDELPPGRLPVKTWLVPDAKRADAFAWIKDQILLTKEKRMPRAEGLPKLPQSDSYSYETDEHFLGEASSFNLPANQAIIVYPLIEDSDHETMADVKAATTEFEKLKKTFAPLNVALIHGRMPAKDKNSIIDNFRTGTIDILVTTSVVEVGIDAPGASIIVVENAERFGLATLHQLRGRVGRRGQQAYCFLFTSSTDELTLQRLKAMETHHNGLNLAKIDLELRGPGQLFGTRQHGVGELKFAKITDIELIEKTRQAVDLLNNQ